MEPGNNNKKNQEPGKNENNNENSKIPENSLFFFFDYDVPKLIKKIKEFPKNVQKNKYKELKHIITKRFEAYCADYPERKGAFNQQYTDYLKHLNHKIEKKNSVSIPESSELEEISLSKEKRVKIMLLIEFGIVDMLKSKLEEYYNKNKIEQRLWRLLNVLIEMEPDTIRKSYQDGLNHKIHMKDKDSKHLRKKFKNSPFFNEDNKIEFNLTMDYIANGKKPR